MYTRIHCIMDTELQAPSGERYDAFSVRLPISKLRELESRARRSGTTRAEFARRLLLSALEDTRGDNGTLLGTLVDDVHSSLEHIDRALTEDAVSRATEMKDVRRTLERALIQQTEILMILRTVTYKDRPEDYEIAMTKTRELLPTVVGGSSRRQINRAESKETK